MIGRVSKWEIRWTGGLPHRSWLPHLHGIPHLHVNRPLVLPLDMQMKQIVMETCDEAFFCFFFFQQKGRRTACSQATCYGRTGWVFILKHRRLENSPFTALNFTAIVRYPTTTMYSDVEPFSKYSPVTLHLSPATRILNESPGRMDINSPSDASKGRLKLFLGIPKKCFDSVCSTRSDCGNSAIRCE